MHAPEIPSAWTPLRHRLFRLLWIASVASDILALPAGAIAGVLDGVSLPRVYGRAAGSRPVDGPIVEGGPHHSEELAELSKLFGAKGAGR